MIYLYNKKNTHNKESYRFKSYCTGTYQFTNLQNIPNFSGTIDQSGDYIGFSLSFHFKRKGK